MANYDVSIKIAIAGAKELDRVNKQTEKLRSSINAVNKTAELSGKKPIRNFNNLSKSVQNARDALDEAATGTKEFNQAVKNLVQVENKFDRQLKQRERRLKIQRLAQKEGISFSKAKILLAKKEAEAEAKLAANKEKTANAEKRRQRGRTISSALIGGAFPLLFGQGLGASIGGAAGGFAGGRMKGKGSEQMGFALSLVGTTLGSQLDRLAQSARELGEALRNPIKNVDLLSQKIGAANTPFGDTVATLKDLGLEGVAAEAVLERFNKTFNTNRKSITELGEESIKFTNELQKLGTGITLLVAGPLTKFLQIVNDTLGNTTEIGVRRDAGLEARKLAMEKFNIGTGIIGNFRAKREVDMISALADKFFPIKEIDGETFEQYARRIEKEILARRMNEAGLDGQVEKDLQRLIKERRDFELLTLQNQLDIEKQSLTMRSEDLDVLKKRLDLAKIDEKLKVKGLVNTKIMTEEQQKAHQFAIDKLEIERQISKELLDQAIIMADPMQAALVGLNKEMEKFNDFRYQAVEFAKAFSGAFENSFKGIIKGTMSIQDAFRNMFMRIADHFLDMAAQMMANQLQRSLLGFISNAFLGGISGGETNVLAGYTITGGATDTSLTTGAQAELDYEKYGPTYKAGSFANGGYAQRNKSYIVGERGPEMFTPGAAGGQVSPMGSTNIVVNVDASGSSVEGDEQGGRELGRLISVAIQSELVQQKRPGGLLA